ncbi:MAG TPA: ribonuclease III [Luteibaculaceae bacterium]|nr:ribonuclease III [Luteibaculaceae bacterium]
MRWGIGKQESFFDRKIKFVAKKYFGFVPHRLDFYHEALIHRSIIDRNSPYSRSNERLEFLGDSMLGAFTAAYLFEQLPDADEGELTKLRSRIVSRSHLNKLAFDLHINVLVKRSLNRGQEANTIYGNALEAFIGAIYLEKGMPFLNHVLKTIFHKHIDLRAIQETDTDYKSRLFEWAQRERKPIRFVTQKEEMVHNRKFYTLELVYDNQVLAIGKGFSKKKAEQEAARQVLVERELTHGENITL